MNRGPDWYDLVDAISAATGHKLARTPVEVVSGGGVSACLRWTSDSGPMFIKVTGADRAWALEAEAEGLRTLASASAIRVPRVLGVGVASNRAWLALEWIDPVSPSPESGVDDDHSAQPSVATHGVEITRPRQLAPRAADPFLTLQPNQQSQADLDGLALGTCAGELHRPGNQVVARLRRTAAARPD